jgi:transcriptional regulator with XRE-family HTH domain
MGDLEQFMRAKGLTDETVADAVGVSRPYLTRLRQGKRSPSLALALKIEAWSEGQVRVAGLSQSAAPDSQASA